jgi:hypothetical protein
MKKKVIVIGLVASSVICNSLYSITIRITKQNGGPNGYSFVSESHNTQTDTHILNCQNPGKEPCVWKYPPIIVQGNQRTYTSQELVDIADKIIIDYFQKVCDDCDNTNTQPLNTKVTIDGILIVIRANKDKKNVIHSDIIIYDVNEPITKLILD